MSAREFYDKKNACEWDVLRIEGNGKSRQWSFYLNVPDSKREDARPIELVIPRSAPDAIICMKHKQNDCNHVRFLRGYLARKGSPGQAKLNLDVKGDWERDQREFFDQLCKKDALIAGVPF
jgi:hypothetical protein